MRRMKFLLFALVLITASISYSQYILKGNVSDKVGAPLPGVKIYVENSTYGVITDYGGDYFLELPKKQEYRVNYTMLGMQDTAYSILIDKKLTEWNVTLIEEVTQLESVEVVTKKINVANQIIRKVRDNRKNLAYQFDNYTCDTYLKTSLKQQPRDLLFSRSDTIDTIPQTTSLIESLSKTTFISPNVYHEKILAHHDYSDKEPVRTGSAIDYFMDDIIVPTQVIEADPYIFFEKVEDGDFNLYQNMINLPRVSEHPITSPLGIQAFTNYKFTLTGIFEENEQKIYEIDVDPRFNYAPLMKGTLYVIDSLWVVKSFNLSVNSSAMPFFKDFTVIQDYEQKDSNWIPVRREYIYTINEGTNYISANTRVNHSNYAFNQAITKKDLKNEISSYADDAFMKDSAYWENSRPIQLKESELVFIDEQIRIDSIKQSEHYLDSVDAEFNKVTFWDVTLNGIGFRNRFKGQEIFISPLIGGIQVIGVGGFRYRASGHYSKKFENKQRIKLTPTLDYGFRTRDLKYALKTEYTFDPLHFGSVEVEAGNLYERLTNQITAVNFVFGTQYLVQNKFFNVAHRREIVNGLYGRVKFEFADRIPLPEDTPFGPITDYFMNSDTIINFFPDPPPFERYLASIFELKLQYRFKQSYIIKNNEKLIIGTEYPELEFTFRQGIPSLFNSEVNFNFVEAKVSDEITLGNYGNSKWKVIGGTFLSKQNLRVVDHQFFKRSDASFFSNPLNTHQTLDTNFHTNGLYAQAFYIHHFNGFFLNKIPLINRMGFEEVVGASFLFLDEQNYTLGEVYVGVEKKFRMFNQYFKYAFFYTANLNSETRSHLVFKFGIDFLNTFTNEWSW